MERPYHEFLAVLGYFYLQHERPQKAAVLFGIVDVLKPGNPVTMKSLALSLVEADRAEEGLAVLDRLSALGVADATTHLLRAKALAKLGRPEQLAAAVETFLAARAST
ncbi:M48 family metallopeptidase [Telmatospirillum sp. J64-1]|uniref:type III secretion apparatus assembly chaperone SctY n=1 Tax=Telmatospirillum sp. J64-1 TaxID=2502183 RepID=UPI00115CC76E|nr:hypothetical protein [Telmatospirillum sp. J64-1]